MAKEKEKYKEELFEKLNALCIVSNPVRFKILLALFISEVLEEKTCKYCDTKVLSPNFDYHICIGRKLMEVDDEKRKKFN